MDDVSSNSGFAHKTGRSTSRDAAQARGTSASPARRYEEYGDPEAPLLPPRPVAGMGGFDFSAAMFKRFPVAFPVSLMLIAPALWLLFHIIGFGVVPLRAYSIAGAVICFAVGAILLPFGIRTSIRRRRPIDLVCPRCHSVSHLSPQPFSIQRWGDVDYAYVVCSVCGKDFTIDRWRRTR